MRKYIGGGDFDRGVNRKIKTPLIAKKKHQYRQPGESSLVSPIDTVFLWRTRFPVVFGYT